MLNLIPVTGGSTERNQIEPGQELLAPSHAREAFLAVAMKKKRKKKKKKKKNIPPPSFLLPDLLCDPVGLDSLGVTCSSRDTRIEVDVFFQDVKFLSTSPPGGTLSWGSRV